MKVAPADLEHYGLTDAAVLERTASGVEESGASELADRILDATLGLVARWGVGKTSLADVAKAAGCSRATLYRTFPGGKQHLFARLGQRELDSYLSAILDAVDTADDLGDALTRGLVVGARLLRDHEGAQFVIEHEPELLVPFLGFKEVDVLYAHISDVAGPHLARFVPEDRARWAAEWASRLFITYLFNPSAEIDLVDVDQTRDLVAAYVLPAFGEPRPA